MAGPRIPLALQAVFTESNQGQEVHKPPTEKVAFKTFFRGFFRTIRGKSNKREQGSPSSVGESSTFEKEKRKQVVAATRKPTAEKGHGGDDQDETFSISQETTLTSGSSLPSTVVNLKVAKSPPKRPPMSPQAYLDLMIHSRGYSTRRFRSVQTGYYNKPTKFQQASYNVHLIKLARKDEVQALREIFEAGISPNPANAFGESLMHMVCRRGHFETLRMMLGTGATVQVCDDYGRTPLHDAFWSAEPSLETVEMVANQDPTLFHLTDTRGALPLSYVRREHWNIWIGFLEAHKDQWWPILTEQQRRERLSPLIEEAPNSRPLPDPKNALSLELVQMVVSGALSLREAKLLEAEGATETCDSDSDEDTESEDDEDDDDSDCSESNEVSSTDDDENLTSFEDLGFSAQDMSQMLSVIESTSVKKRGQ